MRALKRVQDEEDHVAAMALLREQRLAESTLQLSDRCVEEEGTARSIVSSDSNTNITERRHCVTKSAMTTTSSSTATTMATSTAVMATTPSSTTPPTTTAALTTVKQTAMSKADAKTKRLNSTVVGFRSAYARTLATDAPAAERHAADRRRLQKLRYLVGRSTDGVSFEEVLCDMGDKILAHLVRQVGSEMEGELDAVVDSLVEAL